MVFGVSCARPCDRVIRGLADGERSVRDPYVPIALSASDALPSLSLPVDLSMPGLSCCSHPLVGSITCTSIGEADRILVVGGMNMGGIIVSLRQLAPSSCGEGMGVGVEHNLDNSASGWECGSGVADMSTGEGTGTGTGVGKELAMEVESDTCD